MKSILNELLNFSFAYVTICLSIWIILMSIIIIFYGVPHFTIREGFHYKLDNIESIN